MRSRVYLIVLASVFTSCSAKKETPATLPEVKDTVNTSFEAYLSTFDSVALPVVIRGCENVGADKKVLKKGKDVSSIEEENAYLKNSGHPYARIKSNGNFITTITLGLADCYIPVLTTFDSEGKQIDKKSLSIGYCGSDCGYYCREFMKIGEDYTLFTSDSVNTYDCDSLGEMIAGTEKNYVIYKQGRLLPDGRIELSAELRKDLQN